MVDLIGFVAFLVIVANSVSAHVIRGNTQAAKCSVTTNWHGWSSVKYAFSFGDSYTQTGFNTTLTPPSPLNPLGNPVYPGYTSSNGPNWIDYLTVQYNASLLQTYNMAYGGATVDAALVAPYQPSVLSLSDQVEKLFFPAYGSKKATSQSPAWTSSDSLFSIFIGINDVGNSYYVSDTATLNKKILDVYAGLVNMLYNAGARNFLFINVPPVDRSPLTISQGASAAASEKADLAAFNAGIASLASKLKSSFKDVNVFLTDASKIFSTVLDNPKSYAQTSAVKNTTAYCMAYENGTPTNNYYDPACGVPVDQYFWLNSLHPTYLMHQVLAEEVSKTLKNGPNVC